MKTNWKVLCITWSSPSMIQHWVCNGCPNCCRAVLPINEDPPEVCIKLIDEIVKVLKK